MISFETVRRAERTRLENWISAQPSPARFQRSVANGGPIVVTVRTTEPRKSREMKQGGFDPQVDTEAWLVLPIGAKEPQAAKEFIGIVDLAGAFRTYSIISVTALRGYSCFQLGLNSRSSVPAIVRPPVVG